MCYSWGELSSECGATCLRATCLRASCLQGDLSLGRVVLFPFASSVY